MFVKRLLQISLFVQPSFACGILYLVSQLVAKKPALQALTIKELTSCDLDRFGEDDEEYHDIKDEKDDTEVDNVEIKEEKPDTSLLEVAFKGSSWVHTSQANKKHQSKYNPLARNPLFGGGEFLVYSELGYLQRHFHPTVAMWAQHILNGEKVNYTGDPLKDFTLIRFLDR